MKIALEKNYGNSKALQDELNKLKSAYEKDTHIFKLKLGSYKDSIKDRDAQIKDLVERMKGMARDAAKYSSMEQYIEQLEREKDDLKAKLIVELQVFQRKCKAQADASLRTMQEKLTVTINILEIRDNELELCQARNEELEISATS